MALSPNEPNLFELTGATTQITYSTSSFAGQPQLTYRHLEDSGTFTGEEIRVLESEIGRQVTVTLEVIPDLHTVTLTLLVPAINLDGREARFRTRAILTTQRTSIAGPRLVKGALQTYRVLALRGVARIVDF